MRGGVPRVVWDGLGCGGNCEGMGLVGDEWEWCGVAGCGGALRCVAFAL